MDFFKLKNTYEFFVEKNNTDVICRVDVFFALSDEKTIRVRVWLQNIYNLYPFDANSDSMGRDTRVMHSSDQLMQDISSMLDIDPLMLTGLVISPYEELEIVSSLKQLVCEYVKEQSGLDLQ